MEKRKFRLHHGVTGAALAVRVTPRAGKSEIAGVTDDGTVKIRLKAAPVEGQANKELVRFISGVLGVAQSRVEIVAGEKGRDKLVTVTGMDAETVQGVILSLVPKQSPGD